MMNQIISRDPLGRPGSLLLWAVIAAFLTIAIPRSAWPTPVRSVRPTLDNASDTGACVARSAVRKSSPVPAQPSGMKSAAAWLRQGSRRPPGAAAGWAYPFGQRRSFGTQSARGNIFFATLRIAARCSRTIARLDSPRSAGA